MIGINVRELIGWVGTLVIAMGTIYFAFWYVGVWVRYKRYLRRRYSWALGICDGRWGTIYKEETVNAEE